MAKMNESISVDIAKLHLRIFTIGGKAVGESYLILFMEEETVVYSILIDSLVTTIDGCKVNIPLKFIQHYEIAKLDCIVWTHPHDDHSEGLDEIVNIYYGKKTWGFLPKYVYGNKHDIIPITDTCKKVRKMMTTKFKKNRLVSIDCAENESRLLIHREFADRNSEIIKELNIKFLTPIGYPFDQRMAQDKQYTTTMLNSLSLSLVIDFDEYRFYFGGDTPGTKIKQSCVEEIKNSKWTTIPHHGSSSSKQLRTLLPQKIDCATCTTYLSQPLPEVDVLKLYKTTNIIDHNVHVDVTQKTMDDTFAYGIIEYDYDFSSMPNAKLTINRYGNAYNYENE